MNGLFCLTVKHINLTFVAKIFDEVATMDQNDLTAFYFYLGMLYNGIFFLCQTETTTNKRIVQHWTINQDINFSLNFIECLSVRQRDTTAYAKYMLGSVLPCMYPRKKADSDELQEFLPKQYILLHGLMVSLIILTFQRKDGIQTERSSPIIEQPTTEIIRKKNKNN